MTHTNLILLIQSSYTLLIITEKITVSPGEPNRIVPVSDPFVLFSIDPLPQRSKTPSYRITYKPEVYIPHLQSQKSGSTGAFPRMEWRNFPRKNNRRLNSAHIHRHHRVQGCQHEHLLYYLYLNIYKTLCIYTHARFLQVVSVVSQAGLCLKPLKRLLSEWFVWFKAKPGCFSPSSGQRA